MTMKPPQCQPQVQFESLQSSHTLCFKAHTKKNVKDECVLNRYTESTVTGLPIFMCEMVLCSSGTARKNLHDHRRIQFAFS